MIMMTPMTVEGLMYLPTLPKDLLTRKSLETLRVDLGGRALWRPRNRQPPTYRSNCSRPQTSDLGEAQPQQDLQWLLGDQGGDPEAEGPGVLRLQDARSWD